MIVVGNMVVKKIVDSDRMWKPNTHLGHGQLKHVKGVQVSSPLTGIILACILSLED